MQSAAIRSPRWKNPSTVFCYVNTFYEGQSMRFPVRISSIFCIIVVAVFCGSCSDESTNQTKAAAQRGFHERLAETHTDTRHFPLWTAGWRTEDLQGRFEGLHRDRKAVYYVSPTHSGTKTNHPPRSALFQKPDEKIFKKATSPMAFAYNLATPRYNASIITLNTQQFLAFEAPCHENIQDFCSLLTQYHVTDLVRLTPHEEGGTERTVPYWEGHVSTDPATGRSTITLCGRVMNYVYTEYWPDLQGIDPTVLIGLVQAVTANAHPDQMIAVHCHAGIGRTGTFLAAYELMRQIDEQIARGVPHDKISVSVDKVVWELSLQRLYSVTTLSQYETLYRLVEIYIQHT
jgi:hypothetical protein